MTTEILMGDEITDGKWKTINWFLHVELSPDWSTGTLMSDYEALWRRHDPPLVIKLPTGFTTDFASVPRAVWWFCTPLGRHAPAAVVHDWLYYQRDWIRADADQCFLDLMENLGVSKTKRMIMYLMVRLCGWYRWGQRHAS